MADCVFKFYGPRAQLMYSPLELGGGGGGGGKKNCFIEFFY
jgi:hypothetical protein